MESKGCFVCCVLMILVISAFAADAEHEPKAMNQEPHHLIRAERGAISNALKGAAVGGIASKLTGHSALKGAGVGAAGGVVAGKLLGNKNHH
uniref:Glycine zipper 2TM domain-containing protein n=1 Tax=Panagrolaimus sp. ES5 TaxID=591445 RepID=A0AC34F153_9BILA